jgi:hypothetical protein
MANLATQNITRAGVAPTYVAAAGGGDTFTPDDRTYIHVKNASGGAITVTVVTPAVVIPDMAIADTAVSVPAAGERILGPFPPQYYADPADGLADITYSGVTSLTVGVFKLTAP